MNFFYGQNEQEKKESLGETQMCVESNSSGVHIFIAFDERKWRSEKNTARRRCEIEEIEERAFRSRLSVQGKMVRRRKGKLKKIAWQLDIFTGEFLLPACDKKYNRRRWREILSQGMQTPPFENIL